MRFNSQRLALAVSALLITGTPTASFAHDEDIFAPVPEGGLSWDVLMSSEAEEWTDTKAGTTHLRPKFSPEALAQRGKKVTISGFMMGTDEAPEQNHFLLFASPPDCLFHMTVGPARFVEVKTDKRVPYLTGAIAVTGHLELVDAQKGGVFYRISDGQVAVIN